MVRVRAKTGWKSLDVSFRRESFGVDPDEMNIGEILAVRVSRRVIFGLDFH